MIPRFAAAIALYIISCTMSFPCTIDKSHNGTLDAFDRLNFVDICSALARGLGETGNCTGPNYERDDLTVDVYDIDRDEGFVRIDFKIVARSELLSGYISRHGYESHAFEALLFLGLDCVPKYWVTPREPRFLRGGGGVASDAGNINWTLFTDGDRIAPLRDKVRTWFLNSLSNSEGTK